MKNSRYIFYGLVVFIATFFSSCNNDMSDKKSFITLDLSEGLKNVEGHKLSEITQDYKMIKLETNSECLIERITRVLFAAGKIIVMEGSPYFIDGRRTPPKILVFDNNGKFLNRIGGIGKGPGEYTSVGDICIDEKNELIYLLGDGQSMIKYDLKGNFIEESNMDRYPGKIAIFNDNLLFFFPPYRTENNDNFEFAILDYDLNIIKKAISREPNNFTKTRSKLYMKDNNMRYWHNLNRDTIYEINNNLEISPVYYVEYPDKMPIDYYFDSRKTDDYTLTRIQTIYETNNYILWDMIYKKRRKLLMTDLMTKESFGIEITNEWEWEYGGKIGFINDIDGGMRFWPNSNVDDNTLYSYFDIINAKGYITKRQELIDSGTYDKIDVKYPEKQKELEELLKNSDDGDNPVLVLVSLK